MKKKTIQPLPEGFMESFASKVSSVKKDQPLDQIGQLKQSIHEQEIKIRAARMGGVGDVAKMVMEMNHMKRALAKADKEAQPKGKVSLKKAPWEKDDKKSVKESDEMDPVNPKAVKKKFDNRKDKDIDNDGDVDDSDEYLHKRRKAISKAVNEAMGSRKNDKAEGDTAAQTVDEKPAESGHGKSSKRPADKEDGDKAPQTIEEAHAKWSVKVGNKTYTVSGRNTAEAAKKAEAAAKKDGNNGVYDSKHGVKKLSEEEVEQIDEISSNTLSRYITKSAKSVGSRKLSTDKMDNRIGGQWMADQKIRKKQGYSSDAKVAAESTMTAREKLEAELTEGALDRLGKSEAPLHEALEKTTLDEVSTKTLMKYRTSADRSKDRASDSAIDKMLRSKDGPQAADISKEVKTMDKRAKGLKMADRAAARNLRKDLLRKEEVELDEALQKTTTRNLTTMLSSAEQIEKISGFRHPFFKTARELGFYADISSIHQQAKRLVSDLEDLEMGMVMNSGDMMEGTTAINENVEDDQSEAMSTVGALGTMMIKLGMEKDVKRFRRALDQAVELFSDGYEEDDDDMMYDGLDDINGVADDMAKAYARKAKMNVKDAMKQARSGDVNERDGLKALGQM